MARLVSSIGSVALALLLSRFLLDGSAADLGPAAFMSAPALLSLAIAAGLLSRSRLPYLADSVLLALLVPARGPLCDAVMASVPWDWGAPHLAAAVSLLPAGFVLGRHLWPARQAQGLLGPMLGWVLGAVLVELGVVGWLPGAFTGFAVAGALAVLGEVGRSSRGEGQAPPFEDPAWEGLPLGACLALTLTVLERVVPGYAMPRAQVGSELALALMLPALPVAFFVGLLAEGRAARRVLFALGSLLLAWALWELALALGVHMHGPTLVALTRSLRNFANTWLGSDEFRAWLLHFVAMVAVGLGWLAGASRRRAAGPLMLGFGLGQLASLWLLVEPTMAPLHLLLGACGLVAAGCLLPVSRWGWLLLPAAVAPLLFFPEAARVGYDGIRRLGDYAADGWARWLPGDVALFSTGGRDIPSVDGRRAARFSFSGREPYLALDAEDAPRPPLVLERSDDDPGDVERFFGVRFAGVPLSPDHDPVGAEGSVGRMLRLFGRPGRSMVVGTGAELVAADLVAAFAPSGLVVSSPMPLGPVNQHILLGELGLDDLQVPVGDEPRRDLALRRPGSIDLLLLAPEVEGWPLAGWALHRHNLARLSLTLAPGGRCLAWIDTAGLDGRALGARMAAFAAVFGSSSLALVEPRELDAPLVLLVGWVDPSGRPTVAGLEARLPTADATGFRAPLRRLADLGSLLLADGPTMAAAADRWPVFDRGRPVGPSRWAASGWGAVSAVRDGRARLSRSVEGAPETGPLSDDVTDGLARHAGIFYQLERIRGAMLVEPLDDVDWEALDDELDCYVRAAADRPDDPLLLLAAAALLEPLVREGELSRFAGAFQRLDGERLPSWRIALQQATVLESNLMQVEAREALERARRLAGR